MSVSLRNKLIAVIIGVILVGGGLAAVYVLSAKNKAQQEAELSKQEVVTVEVVQARRGDIERSFLFTGSLEANHKAEVVSKIPGKASRVLVDEGDLVRRGQILVELERADLLAQREQARAAVQMAEARVKQAESGQTLQIAQTDTTIEATEAGVATAQSQREQARINLELVRAQTGTGVQQAQEQLRQAQAQLAMIETGAREQEIEIARQAAQQAKAGFDTAATNLERARQLLGEGAISQQQFDAAQLQFDTAQARYTSAVQQLNLVEEGARSEEIQIAQAQVNQAQSAVALAQANRSQVLVLEQQLQAAQEAIRQAEANLRLAQAGTARNVVSEQETEAARSGLSQARANLQYLNAQVSYTSIRAPLTGFVVARMVEPGEAALPGVPLFNIVDNRKLYLRSRIAETRISDINVAQPVTLTVDALPEADFAGQIEEIIPAVDPQSRTIDVKIEVPNPRGLLKAGMFARASVAIERRVGVILVPREAVLEDQQGKYILTVQQGIVQRRAVTTGLNDETDVAITEGLTEGARIVARGQSLVKPGDHVNMKVAD